MTSKSKGHFRDIGRKLKISLFFSPVSREFVSWRPVRLDCVHHQEVPANCPGFALAAILLFDLERDDEKEHVIRGIPRLSSGDSAQLVVAQGGRSERGAARDFRQRSRAAAKMSARFLQLSDGAPSRPNDCGTETSRAPADDTKPGEAEEHHRPGRRLWHRNRIGRAGQHAKGELGGEGVSGGGRMLLVPEQILVRIRADGPGDSKFPEMHGLVTLAKPKRAGLLTIV